LEEGFFTLDEDLGSESEDKIDDEECEDETTDKVVTVKLGIWTEMSGPKSCEALASTYRLCRSLDGCLEFWRSGRSRRVQS